MEKRFISSSIELRAQGDSNKLVGYAATYNQRSLDLGGFTEVLAPGVFDRSMKENGDVAAYYEHNPSNGILGRTPTTLKLRSDDTGLAFELDIPNTTLGNDLKEMVKRGDIRNMSFGFVCNDDKWENRNGEVTRTVTDADIHEISFVSFPAYPSSSAALRSLCFPDGAPAVPAEVRADGGKTKKVDGYNLTAADFLLVGDPDKTETWALPVHFPNVDATVSHIKNAMARINQVEGFSADQINEAKDKLVKLAEEHGIDVSDDFKDKKERSVSPTVSQEDQDYQMWQLAIRRMWPLK